MIDGPVTEDPATEAAESQPAELPEAEVVTEPSTPGAVLRRARVASGHSIADVVHVIASVRTR